MTSEICMDASQFLTSRTAMHKIAGLVGTIHSPNNPLNPTRRKAQLVVALGGEWVRLTGGTAINGWPW